MGVKISIIDKRVHHRLCAWGIAAPGPTRIVVDSSSVLADVLIKVKNAAGRGKISLLSITAHGFGRQDAKGRMHGGFGVEFCKDTINLKTVRQFRKLRGMFDNKALGIELVGCAAAGNHRLTTAQGKSVAAFGWRMCKELAGHTLTGVKASTDMQDLDLKRYSYVKRVHGIPTNKTDTCADPGKWEGQVWIFAPNGTVRKV